jgi:hypothetical protein
MMRAHSDAELSKAQMEEPAVPFLVCHTLMVIQTPVRKNAKRFRCAKRNKVVRFIKLGK